jgi:Pectate lyase superfamily protein
LPLTRLSSDGSIGHVASVDQYYDLLTGALSDTTAKLSAKLLDWGGGFYNVKSAINPSGPAVGDGSTNDAASIQAAIDAAAAAGGGIVYFPNTINSYWITSTLNLKHGVILVGATMALSAADWATYGYGNLQAPQMSGSVAGVRLTWGGAANGTAVSCNAQRSAGMQHIGIDGAAGTAGIGLDLMSSFGCFFEDVMIHNVLGTPGYGLRLGVNADAANNNCEFNRFIGLEVLSAVHDIYLSGGATGLARVTLNQFTDTFLLTSLATSRGVTLNQMTDTNWWFGIRIFATNNSATAYGIVVNDTGTPTAQVGADGNMFYGLSFNGPSASANNIGVLINTSQLNVFYSNFWICKAGNERSVPAGSQANTAYRWELLQQNNSIETIIPGPVKISEISGQSAASFGWRYNDVDDLALKRESSTAYVLRALTPNKKALVVDQTTGNVQLGDAGVTTLVNGALNLGSVVHGTGGSLQVNNNADGQVNFQVNDAGDAHVPSGSLSTTKATPAYSASITPNAFVGNWQTITVTNGTAFTINAPTNPPSTTGTAELTIEILNSSGGAMGVITWNGAFIFAGITWANPASTKKRYARFEWNGLNWIATGFSTADY